VALALVGAAPVAAKSPPKAPGSAVSQYLEVVPGAGGAKPSSGRAKPPSASGGALTGASTVPAAPAKPSTTTAKPSTTTAKAKPQPAPTKPPAAPAAAANPVSAAFAPSGSGLGGGTLLAIILGAIAVAGTALFAVRRRLGRR